MIVYWIKNISNMQSMINDCQSQSHVQQVVFSTYHNCLTQICFTCECVRTNMSIKETDRAEEEPITGEESFDEEFPPSMEASADFLVQGSNEAECDAPDMIIHIKRRIPFREVEEDALSSKEV